MQKHGANKNESEEMKCFYQRKSMEIPRNF